ncbi:MAG: PASTA domain-containing protein, partial [Dehalococcoidia bacterium]|nr:PASTA domain-containing protein [Dehalococcoidia bacterium]
TPNVIGVPRAEAERVLRAAGATPLIVEAANPAPAGTVYDQDPEPGATLVDGAIVTLYLSQGQ